MNVADYAKRLLRFTQASHARLGGYLQLILSAGRWCLPLLLLIPAPALADEFIELVIPLREGRYYSSREFCRQCNERLGASYELDKISDQRRELTALERLALVAAQETGLLQVRVERERLVLLVPNPEDDRTRKRNRERLACLFSIDIPDWPVGKGLHLPKNFQPDRRTILLIHGLESGQNDLARFREACLHSNIQVLTFDYPNDGPLAWSGDQLGQDLQRFAKQHPRARLAIVGHSMGGLVAGYCLEMPGKDPGCVTDLFCLGTPHKGTPLAAYYDWLVPVFELGTGTDAIRDGLGEAADDLLPNSAFLKALNAASRNPRVKYHVAAGDRGFITPDHLDAARGELTELLEHRRVPEGRRKEILKLFGFNEVRSGLGDGIVSLESATLPGVKEQRFACNHLELLSLPGESPEASPVFRWVIKALGWVKNTESAR